ncbi:type II toxin-antitoxin system RelE/ParE family toxin [Xanthomonas campestris pv. campestris]|nr:type II toxin-antitoxin system RelE/ParE family toxin [Xanthomonas campestris]WDI85288.1 type II toxin-antitoxin system RelE/ParE family toxin [Xanthomonas campestris pv. campestris]
MGKKIAHAVEWTQFALEDLNAVIDYIAQDNPGRAYEFAAEIYDKTVVLEQYPAICVDPPKNQSRSKRLI